MGAAPRDRGGVLSARLRRLAPALAGAAAAACAALALRSGAAGRAVRDKLIATVESSIQGTLEIEALRLGPSLTATARRVRLRAPDGALAVDANAVRLTLDPRALLSRHPAVALVVEDPVVDVTALGNALAGGGREGGGAGFALARVDVVASGAVLVLGPTVRAEDVSLAAIVTRRADGLSADLSGTGRLVEPAREPLAARALLAFAPGAPPRVNLLRARAGDSSVAADAVSFDASAPFPAGRLVARLDPATVRTWAGFAPPSDLRLDAAGGDGAVVARVRAASGGAADVVARRSGAAWVGALSVRDLDAPVWKPGGPGGPLDAVAGFAVRPDDGAWAVHVGRARMGFGDRRLGPIEATVSGRGQDASARVFRLEISERGKTWRLARPATVSLRGGALRLHDVTLAGPVHVPPRDRENDAGVRRVAGEAATAEYPVLTADGTWPPTARRPLILVSMRVRLEDLPSALLPARLRLAGRLDGVAHLSSAPPAGSPFPDGRYSLHLRHGHLGGLAPFRAAEPIDLVANVTIARGAADATFDVVTADGAALRASVRSPLRVPGGDDVARLDTGFRGLSVRGVENLSGGFRAALARGRAWFTADLAAGSAGIGRLSGSGTVDPASLARAPHLPALAIRLEDVSLDALAAAGLLPAGTGGRARGVALVAPGGIDASLVVDGARLAGFGGWPIAVIASVRGERALLAARGRSDGHRSPLPGLRAHPHGGGAAGAAAAFSPPLERLPSEGLRAWRWRAHGALENANLGSASEAPPPPAFRTLPSAPGRAASGRLRGRLDGAVAVRGGSGSRPQGWGWAAARAVRLDDAPAGDAAAAAHLRGDRIAAWVRASGARAGRFAAVGRLAPGRAWSETPFSAIAAADAFPLETLRALAPASIRRLEGSLSLRATVSGTPADPRGRARVSLRDGVLRTAATGTLRRIALDVTVEPGEIRVDELSVLGPHGGPLVLSARARRGPPGLVRGAGRAWALSGSLRARRFELDGDPVTGGFDGRARIGGEIDPPSLVRLRLRFEGGTVRLPGVARSTRPSLAAHPDFVVAGEDSGAVAVAGHGSDGARDAETPRVEIRLETRENLRVIGPDADVSVAGDVHIETGGEGTRGTRVGGHVRAPRGSVTVAGKDFELEGARVELTGGAATDARLDVVGRHTVEGAGPEVEPVEVRAHVTGTIGKPSLELTSDPPLPEDAIVSLIFLGVQQPRPGLPAGIPEEPSLAGRAATLLGNYLTARLRERVQRVVPVDVLELETGTPGSATEGRLRVGKYLAPGLFLSYAHAFGAAEWESVNTVRLEWRIRRRWRVVSEISDGNRGHVDLVWTREF